MSKTRALAKMIDHSILHPTMTDADLKKECEIAKKYDVASVCVKPYMVPMAVDLLKGTDVLIGCVIGFPAGNSTVDVKVFEAAKACKDGAVEIDMVINIAKALQGDWDYLEREIGSVTGICHELGAIVKVIFETDYVTKESDILKLCQICTKVCADYVKTSSGFGFVKGNQTIRRGFKPQKFIHKKGAMYALTIHRPQTKIINILKTDQLTCLYKLLSL